MKETEMQPQIEYDPRPELERAVNNFEVFWKQKPMSAERHYLGLPEQDAERLVQVRQELAEITKQKAHEQRDSW